MFNFKLYPKDYPYAPYRITSVQIIPGAEPNVLHSEPPPGWIGLSKSVPSPEQPGSDDGCDPPEGVPDEPVRDSDEPQPPPPTSDKNTKVPSHSKPEKYIFSKRKINNTPVTKYWIVRHGGTLSAPPEEVDARECSGGLAFFINVSPSGIRQIWLWNTTDEKWEAVRAKHVVDLDGTKRELSLGPKDVPVFTRRANGEKGGEKGSGAGSSRFVQYIPPQSRP